LIRQLSIIVFLSGLLSHPAIASFSHNACSPHLIHHENQRAIPAGLLQAISRVESGRKTPTGQVRAWPWTVNAQGQSYYFATKEAAIAAVQAMLFKGIKSIDVGCMQVNLYHHPRAFKNLDDAFDPAQNVAYAALFLNQLKNEHGSWHTAVAHYHSANPVFHIPYRKSVLAAWRRQEHDSPSLNTGRTPMRCRTARPLMRLATTKTSVVPSKRNVHRVTRNTAHHLKHAAYRKF